MPSKVKGESSKDCVFVESGEVKDTDCKDEYEAICMCDTGVPEGEQTEQNRKYINILRIIFHSLHDLSTGYDVPHTFTWNTCTARLK